MVLTKDYYNNISYDLQNQKEIYYNGSLMIDLDTDPSTFVDQDVNNIIKHSEMGNSVLECGCGGGYFFKKLIEKKPSIFYRGIDLSENQIENAKIINPDYSENFQVCDWNSLPFDDESFDTILFLETIGYAKNIDQLLSECYRVLKPGGTIFSKHPGCIDPKFVYLNDIDQNLVDLSNEYGYEEGSLGMMMDVSQFLSKLESNNFSVPNGYITPTRDESLYIKSHFIEEVHYLMDTIKVGETYLTAKYPSKFPKELSEEDLLNNLGKKHPNLVKFFRSSYFNNCCENDTCTEWRSTQKIMSPCVIVTAYKE